jgi:hypothetical protein
MPLAVFFLLNFSTTRMIMIVEKHPASTQPGTPTSPPLPTPTQVVTRMFNSPVGILCRPAFKTVLKAAAIHHVHTISPLPQNQQPPPPLSNLTACIIATPKKHPLPPNPQHDPSQDSHPPPPKNHTVCTHALRCRSGAATAPPSPCQSPHHPSPPPPGSALTHCAAGLVRQPSIAPCARHRYQPAQHSKTHTHTQCG